MMSPNLSFREERNSIVTKNGEEKSIYEVQPAAFCGNASATGGNIRVWGFDMIVDRVHHLIMDKSAFDQITWAKR